MLRIYRNYNFEKLYKYSFLLLAFVLPLSKAMISIFSAFILFLWLIEGKYKKKLQLISENNILLVLLGFIFMSYLSFLWSENVTIKNIVSSDYKFLFLIPIFYTVMKREWLDLIITAFLSGMFVSEIISYGMFFGFWQTSHGTAADPTPFMNHIQYSVFLAFAAILLISRLISKKNTLFDKLLILPFSLTVTINLFITGGKTGQVSFLIAICILFLIHYRITFKSVFLSLISITIIVTIAYTNSTIFHHRIKAAIFSSIKIYENNDFSSTIGLRASYYLLVNDILKDDVLKLVFGVGKNDAQKEIIKIIEENKNSEYKNYKLRINFLEKNLTHNQYLEILLEIGLVGLSLFIFMFYLIIKKLTLKSELSEVFLLFLVIYLISMIFDMIMKTEFTRSLFILFMSIGLVGMTQKNYNLKNYLITIHSTLKKSDNS
jgi:O-antigen ligase